MQQDSSQIKYLLYARKSSESEDRQIQSIDDQVKRLKQLAGELHLKIEKIYTEAKSAKKPDNRPIFSEVLSEIESGEADGILCWQINRLTRNPIDSGKISWLLQRGILKSIQTIDRQYLPEDNVLLFNVESGMANQFIIDLRKNTRRGVDSKLEKGWLPSLAPVGYMNEKVNKTIAKDPERFSLVRKMWDLMLTGNYTPPQILKIITDDWGFTTRRYGKTGGTPLTNSGIYRLFNNVFYAGIIEWDSQEFPGKHEPMITMEEFEHVQYLLGRSGRPRPKTHEFAFTGMIHCGECGCLHTAETKRKIIKSTGELKEYTYYHCTRKTRRVDCSQKRVLEVSKLELQIEQELERYTIMPEFLHWALEILNKNNDQEIQERTKIYEMQHKTLAQTQKDLDELTKMRYRLLIDDEEFVSGRDELQKKIREMKEKLRETENRAEKWIELTEKTFVFATYARSEFIKGDLQKKREILAALGSNPIINNGKLDILAYEWFQRIGDEYPELEEEYLGLELGKMPVTKAKTEALDSIYARWGQIVKDIRTGFERMDRYIYIPELEHQV